MMPALHSQAPSKPVRVVNIRFGQYGGSLEGCCSTEMQVSAGEATLVTTSARDELRRYPKHTVRADVSSKHWRELLQLVDHDALFSLPDHTSCGTCIDGIDEFVEVTFRDQTRKRVTWGLGLPPKELKDLVDRLRALEDRLLNEFGTV